MAELMATLGLFGDAISHAVLPVWQCAGCSAMGMGVSSAVIGLWLSVVLDVASGGTIVLVAISWFFMALLFSPKQGVLMRQRRR